MSPVRLALIIICLFALLYVAYLVRKKRLNLKYSLLWMALAIVVLICAIFPIIAYTCAWALGFQTASNFIFVVAIFFLLAICLSLSVIASSQARKAKRAIQEIAYLDKRVRELEAARNSVKEDADTQGA